MFITAKSIPFRPNQCESCKHFDSGAKRCEAPAFSTPGAFRPLLPSFSGESTEPCPQSQARIGAASAPTEIYLCRPGGQKEGPFALEHINRDLAAKKYTEEDLWAWYEGLKEWIPLYSIPGVGKASTAVHSATSPPSRPAERFTKKQPREDYPSRLASLWASDHASLPLQLWIRFQQEWMAETVATLRPSSIEQHLSGVPEIIGDCDGTGVVQFQLRDGSHIVSVIKALVPVLSGQGCGGKKPVLSGGAA